MVHKRLNDPSQLDLFAHSQHERTPELRPDGGNPLAPALPPDGAPTHAAGSAANGPAGRAGAELGRNGDIDADLSAAGVEPATGARSGVGTGPGAIHPPAGGAGQIVPL